ncbi:NFACT family protein [Leptolyngbya sp. FACHB-261]|uniref:Rqc2 family fibronectin-binding protein n=1 Tax=Leptolyngbya sp. FACHB-261 TaxID=2692806 RepID=UPI001688A56F|nr:NFACT RNA binding domain-containing protein [Leptolyngbya sp. FACHB-261]MBD2101421.1 NFACT family protein [Leptolyngbya sp. FACHB-261]
MQAVDFTTLVAAVEELRQLWLPARLEQVYQLDRTTLALGLRTLQNRGWLTLSWHPQFARLHLGDPPPRTPDTFTFSEQLRHALNGLALVSLELAAPWERVLDLQFARRPGDSVICHLYAEIMGKYSNLVLVDAQGLVVSVAHQVSEKQSSVRPVLTGRPYELPPALTATMPSLNESFERWQERVALVPGPLKRNLLQPYRGLSSPLVLSLIREARCQPETSTADLSSEQWQNLFAAWRDWLTALETRKFTPGLTATGYTVLGWQLRGPTPDVQTLLNSYYQHEVATQTLTQRRAQVLQVLGNRLSKLQTKAQTFHDRLGQSDRADEIKTQADLLMAHLQEWQPGLTQIVLQDFETGEPIAIPLDPERNAVQNAQLLYKRHQKARRAREAVEPLLAQVDEEIQYLEQVEAAVQQLGTEKADRLALDEVREELIQQNYLEDPDYRPAKGTPSSTAEFHHYRTPSNLEILVGRNNRQNDLLTFKIATDYDLWFHAQEIPGSHVLLRLEPGQVPDEADLKAAADVAAYHSRARQSEQVPVVYVHPSDVLRLKGFRPGMITYRSQTVIWGQPNRVKSQET